MSECDKYGHKLVLCPSDWPSIPDVWVCSDCKSTFFKEDYCGMYSLIPFELTKYYRDLNEN